MGSMRRDASVDGVNGDKKGFRHVDSRNGVCFDLSLDMPLGGGVEGPRIEWMRRLPAVRSWQLGWGPRYRLLGTYCAHLHSNCMGLGETHSQSGPRHRNHNCSDGPIFIYMYFIVTPVASSFIHFILKIGTVPVFCALCPTQCEQ